MATFRKFRAKIYALLNTIYNTCITKETISPSKDECGKKRIHRINDRLLNEKHEHKIIVVRELNESKTAFDFLRRIVKLTMDEVQSNLDTKLNLVEKPMVLSHSPEIVTISDSDEELSQDLFNSTTEEEETPNGHFDSHGDLGVVTISKNTRDDCNAEAQCSSSIISSPQVNSEYVLTKDLPISSNLAVYDVAEMHTNECKKEILKFDSWTKDHMDQISKKLEERRKIMTDLVRSDEVFLNSIHDSNAGTFEEESRGTLINGANSRKKIDRAKMQGVTCAESKAYFDALELSPESKERRINQVSRVRVVAQRMPSTPENYWEVGFPSESEQRRRGLITEVHVMNKKGRKLFHENV
ncbi:hypothetical protein DICVIV_06645 [Dictyocaulus viviparus]|uniref:DNA endonuclease activator Ctp1 C-terminal domain-containing protein n=1 Tax=Dictyocaulus viviparus TaxID=29172 RepID=A0A0D8XU69_DICVI|nr:hypothetical protein DICVIV_06645 [Dictyocaulus viviparus]